MKNTPFLFPAVFMLAIFSQHFACAQPATGETPVLHQMTKMDPAKYKTWFSRWQTAITGDAKSRYCDKELGEETGWLMAPLMNGFYYGYLATQDTKWIDREVDWTDSWVKRGVTEPDGYVGWPKAGAAGTDVDDLNSFDADSLLGDAMVLKPVVMMSREILKTPELKEKYGEKATAYIALAEKTYEKWDKRGAWRDTEDGGNITIVLPYGIDQATGKWTDGYDKRNAPATGFSHPDNKANAVAEWMLAMFDATGKPIYKTRAEKWYKVMKSRMKLNDDGTYVIWNYWQPAGPWDYKPDGTSTKHWVGIHPNKGYYQIDVQSIVDAYNHGLVFDAADIQKLIATSKFEKRTWTALVPFDEEIQKDFEEGTKPEGWGSLANTPWYLGLQIGLDKK